MGWTSFRKPAGFNLREFLTEEFSWNSNQVIDMSIKSTTAYLAVKNFEKGFVYAVVVLTSTEKGEFYYKEMDETVGPFECDCPERMLKLLSPTESEYANNWRDRCWANLMMKKQNKKPSVKDGDIIQFDSPIKFTNGYQADTFHVTKDGRSYVFQPVNKSFVCKISKWREREFKVVTERYLKTNKGVMI